jgi:TetR/AcrR family tetracycline transcriptional repressor
MCNVHVQRTVNSYVVQLSSVTVTHRSVSRPKLDREVVVDTALRVADADGLESVTIRRLAQELSVTPMALYWHFSDKDALLAAVADRMWSETAGVLEPTFEAFAGSDDAEDGWELLPIILDALVTVMRRHPAVAELAPSRVVQCEPGLAITERTLRLFAEQGFDAEAAAGLAAFVLCSAVMLVTQQPGAGITVGERSEVQRRKRIALASLPPDRYPNVVAAAEWLTECAVPDSYFQRGVAMISAGVRGQAPTAR